MRYEPVTRKEAMYALLAGGAFGNTIPQFFSVAAWQAAGGESLPFWGVRTLQAGGPCRLNCPAAEVEETACRPEYSAAGINISVMVSSIGQVTWLGDVWDNQGSIECSGIEYPERVHNWRELMRHPVRWTGTAARMLLRRHLNPSSLADLYAIFDLWPEHVVELSAMDRNYGTVPGRNAVVWEVRAY